MHHLIAIWVLGVLAIALIATWDNWSYASWQFHGYTGTKMPRWWLKPRKSYGTSMHAWEFALRIGNRLHAIVVWW